jgi:hypothetical protein
MKKIQFLVLATLISGAFASLFLFSQNKGTTASSSDNNSSVGGGSLTNFLVDNFEDAGSWQGSMPNDLGIIRVLRREGGPKDLRSADSNANRYVLGAKVNYFKTGPSWFAVSPPKDVAIPGASRSFTMWVAGRSFNHVLKILYKDFNNEPRFSVFGKLNFPGWQKLQAQVPPSVIQDNYKLNAIDHPRGIRLTSLLIECAMEETSGEYFVYFDDLRAQTDMFVEDNRDPDDPQDDW